MPYLPETLLLRPVDPAQHSDDWPILELSSCEVFAQDQERGGDDIWPDTSQGLQSLLMADVRNPLLVRGKLLSVPRELAHLRLRASSGTELMQVEHVKQFSYGQYDDGRVEIWAAGASAWYTLKPSRLYRPFYEAMLEAVRILYFCTDVYEGQSTKSRRAKTTQPITADSVLARYAAANGITQDDVETLFGRHARFLLKSMLHSNDSIDWSKTDLWTWLVESFPEVYQEVLEAQRLAGAALKATTKRKKSQAVKRATTVSAKRQRTNSRSSSDEVPRAAKKTRGHKGKSTLRPRPSKYITRARSSISDQSDVLDGQDDDNESHEHPSALSNLQHPAQAGDDESDEPAETSSDEASLSESEASTESDISLGPLSSTFPIHLEAHHLQTNDPADIWSCPLDGCMHRVYAASEHDSQKLIKIHYRQHVDDDDAETRLELVRKMQAGGLAVNRLMNRIQAFKSQMPQPIVQKY